MDLDVYFLGGRLTPPYPGSIRLDHSDESDTSHAWDAWKKIPGHHKY